MTLSSDRSFFGACLLLRSAHDGAVSTNDLWEESIVIVRAASEAQAEARAAAMGRQREVSYRNAANEAIAWVFVQVERVYRIDDALDDGAEVFSRFLRNSEVESLLAPFDDRG